MNQETHRDYANHTVDSVDIVSVALQFEARGCGLFPRPSVGGVHGSHGHRIELSGAMPVGEPTEQRSTGFSVKFSDAYRRKFLKSNFRQYGQMKSRDGKSQRREEKTKKRKSQKKEDPSARKGRKVTKHYVFPMICGSGGSKNRLAKAAGVEPAGQMRDEKLHAVVVRSTFPSQNVQNTPWSDHFWKLSCRKSARRCGAKHISNSKCTKHTIVGPLLEVEMSKNCTPLWREAHFE